MKLWCLYWRHWSLLTEPENAVSRLTLPEIGGTPRRWRRSSSSTGRSRCRKHSVSAASSIVGRKRKITLKSSWIACSRSTNMVSLFIGRARERWAFLSPFILDKRERSVPEIFGDLLYFWINTFILILSLSPPQDGDVIELCQVSDTRAGGVPKVQELFHCFEIIIGFNLFKYIVTIYSKTNIIFYISLIFVYLIV